MVVLNIFDGLFVKFGDGGLCVFVVVFFFFDCDIGNKDDVVDWKLNFEFFGGRGGGVSLLNWGLFGLFDFFVMLFVYFC